VTVANQNGKLFERINTNYATGTFVHDTAATLDLAGCTTPNGLPCQAAGLRPDNAPICPITESTSRFTFVTLRGGGLFVVDSRATPMAIVGEYDTSIVKGNGCLGAEVPGKMYIDSGGGTAANLHQADLYRFPTDGYSGANPPNTPAPTLVFSDPSEGADAHGAALTKDGDYLWIADRGRNFVWVVDTALDQIVNMIPLEGEVSTDPTPDLIAVSPDGSHAFLSLRGPVPLTADPHVSTGSTPGVGILKVTDGGRDGIFEAVAQVSNVDQTGVERADVHAMTIRIVAGFAVEARTGDTGLAAPLRFTYSNPAPRAGTLPAPFALRPTPGTPVVLEAPRTTAIDGQVYQFTGWRTPNGTSTSTTLRWSFATPVTATALYDPLPNIAVEFRAVDYSSGAAVPAFLSVTQPALGNVALPFTLTRMPYEPFTVTAPYFVGRCRFWAWFNPATGFTLTASRTLNGNLTSDHVFVAQYQCW
jgi:hypothetical protein